MSSLYTRLALVLLVIVGGMGAAFYWFDRVNTRTYYAELTQRLNAPIAMYVTEQQQLIVDGVPDLEGLNELAARAMVVNPTAEIYLLDASGNIVGDSLPEDAVQRSRVDLAPVRALIDGDTRFPIYGDDPRGGAGDAARKVFSAWPVTSEAGTTEGYLYVVLGGQTYETLADSIGGTYAAKARVIAVGAVVLFTVLAGLLLFAVMTRRLNRLNREMQRVTQSQFEHEPALWSPHGDGDEIDQLAVTFSTMAKRIREQIDQLTENDRLRRELVSNISHDLRTPLAAMQGYIDTMILKNGRLSAADRDEYLRIAQKHALRLGSLIGDLFELSKLDAASVAPSLESFSLAELVQDIAQEFQIASEHKRLRLGVVADRDAPQTLGDIGLIHRVLENLVKNAIQFAPEGGEVTISIAEKPGAVAVAVSDNGPGIPPADVPRIFDRFWRARDGEEARSDSSGLGLAIVKRILDLHDSRITVVSRPNEETRFEFELPRVRRAA